MGFGGAMGGMMGQMGGSAMPFNMSAGMAGMNLANGMQ